MAVAETTRQELLANLPADKVVELDVRPILRNGGEPFSVIMKTVDTVPPGGVFRLRATFKPVPLFAALKVKGWDHWVVDGAGDDWQVWFYRHSDFA